MIPVLYSCVLCGIQKRECMVPERGETEDVVHWMRDTLPRSVQADHLAVSPNCTADKISEVYIPIDGADKIGGPPIQ